jgi:hypothetical protein
LFVTLVIHHAMRVRHVVVCGISDSKIFTIPPETACVSYLNKDTMDMYLEYVRRRRPSKLWCVNL